jgi:RNA polymerase sigma-70 factor (ECF subfamily)
VIQDPDRALARKARRGDRRALEQLYERHRVPTFSLLVRLLRDRALAEDAFQEVWIKVMNGIRTYDPKVGTFRSWLGRIAHNAAIDRVRRESRHAGAAELDAPIDDSGQSRLDLLESGGPGPDRTGEANVLAERLGPMLAALPDRQRAAVLMRHQLGMSYAEISEALGIPEGTAKTSVHRGLQALRNLWKESVS